MILLTDKKAPTGQLSKLKGCVCINTQTNPLGRYITRDKRLESEAKINKPVAATEPEHHRVPRECSVRSCCWRRPPRREAVEREPKMLCVASTQQASLGPAPVAPSEMDLLFPGGSRGSHALLPVPSPSLMEAGVWSTGLGTQGMCGRIPSAEGPRPSPRALRKGNVGAASPLRPQACTPLSRRPPDRPAPCR